MKVFVGIFALLVVVVSAQTKPKLNIVWFNWDPCVQLSKIALQFPDADVVTKCPPLSEWYGSVMTSLINVAAGTATEAPDVPILDSQWLGEAVKRGLVQELTSYVTDEDRFDRQDFYEQALTAYGEYPPESKRFYGIGFQGDVQMVVYRKDLFQQLGIEEPQTLEELLVAGQKIQRSGATKYGFTTFWCGRTNGECYDETTSIVSQFMYMAGGKIWDPSTYRIDGVFNSPENQEALRFVREFYNMTSKVNNLAFGGAINELCSGDSPFLFIWMGLGANFLDALSCPMAANFGFMPIPAYGKTGKQILSLGGMGMHLSKFSKNADLAQKFLEWFMSRKIQRLWSLAGGSTLRKSVISTNEFIQGKPYNLVYFRSYALTKDIWNIPEYTDLLKICQDTFTAILDGTDTVEHAMQIAARDQQKVIDTSYPFGPPGKELTDVVLVTHGSISKLAIGLIIGGCILVLIVIAVVFFVFHRRTSKTLVNKYETVLTEAGKRVTEAEKRANSFLVNIQDIAFGKRIGEGMFGEVYQGVFRDTKVAIKKLKQSHMSKQALDDFVSEVRLTSSLRHPNCVLLIGAVTKAPDFCIVVEYMENGSLYSVLHDSGIFLDMGTSLQLALDAGLGMNYLHLHDPPIIHRDFKSLNCLIDASMTLKVSDFGLVAVKGDPSKKSDAEGSLYWMAPELLNGAQATTKSDVYAYGITLWEIFMRKDPYDGANPLSVAARVMEDPNFRPVIGREVPTELAALMKRCWHHNPDMRPTFKEIIQILEAMVSAKNNGSAMRSVSETRVKAPTGTVALLFSDVENSTSLWETLPYAMREALQIHNAIFRALEKRHQGYEVKTEGDSFMIAFPSARNAMLFAREVQLELLGAKWPKEILDSPHANTTYDLNKNVIQRGLRVRMGLHVGSPSCQLDPTTRRFDYFGPDVNRASRISGIALGGQVLASSAFAEAVGALQGEDLWLSIGSVKLRGFADSEVLQQLQIAEVRGRKFPLPQEREGSGSTNPASMRSPPLLARNGSNSSIGGANDAAHKQLSAFMQEHRWLIKFNDIELGQLIGMGSYGEVYEARWKGQAVAVKKLLNQRIDDALMLDFYAEVSIHSSIRHPNTVLFLGAVMEPPNISIVTALQVNGSLSKYMLQHPKELTFKQRIKIATEVASALEFLHSSEPPILHRDLKSHNILLSAEMIAHVGDFGFSTLRRASQVTTSVGSASWMAPEVLSGESYNEAADVFSFGVVLWELFSEKDPSEGLSSMLVARRTMSGKRPNISEAVYIDSKHRDTIVGLIQDCWSQTAQSRPRFPVIRAQLAKIKA